MSSINNKGLSMHFNWSYTKYKMGWRFGGDADLHLQGTNDKVNMFNRGRLPLLIIIYPNVCLIKQYWFIDVSFNV